MKKNIYVYILLLFVNINVFTLADGIIDDKKIPQPQQNLLDGLTVNGRVHMKARWYSGDLNEGRVDDMFVDRARLTITKDLGNNFMVIIEGNFAGSSEKSWYLGDAYIGYKLPAGMLRIGNQNPDYSLTLAASTNLYAFNTYNRIHLLSLLSTENITTGNVYLPGVSYRLYGARGGVALGVYGKSNDETFVDEVERELRRYMGRFYFAPLKNEEQTLHFGININYEDGGLKSIDDRNHNLIGEFGYQYKMAYINAEYIDGSKKVLGERTDFSGYSTELIINLTGEKSGYVMGTFGGLKVISPLSRGGNGTFYVGIRYSNAEEIEVENMKKITTQGDIALGWAPEDNVRLILEYGKKQVKTVEKSKGDSVVLQARYFF
jgi:phosphate-selective porin